MELVKRAFSDEPFVYLFVSRKSEPDLVSSFVAEVNAVRGLHVSEDTSRGWRRTTGLSRKNTVVRQVVQDRALCDPFYRFWFRFVFRYDYMAQIGAWENLRRVVLRNWDAFTGLALERWFRARLAESGEWTRMGTWWDRKGENGLPSSRRTRLSGARRSLR